jgi:probable F420-dependent oxidoreductase
MRAYYHEIDGDLRRTAATAQRVERLGFDGYAASEFHADPMLQLTVASAAAPRIALEARVVLAYPRSPMVLAYQAWSLQAYCGGRLELGVASSVQQQMEQRYSARWLPIRAGMRDYMEALRSVWRAWEAGQHPNYVGRYYHLATRDDTFLPPPNKLPFPMLSLGATGPRMCEMAGEIADRLLLPILNSRRYILECALPAMQEGARKAKRAVGEISVTATAFVFVANDKAALPEARNRARKVVAFFLGYTDAYREVTKVHGWGDKHEYLRRKVAEGTSTVDLVSEIDDAMVETFAVVSLPDEIGPRLRERYAGALDAVVFTPRHVGLSAPEQDRALQRAVEVLHDA